MSRPFQLCLVTPASRSRHCILLLLNLPKWAHIKNVFTFFHFLRFLDHLNMTVTQIKGLLHLWVRLTDTGIYIVTSCIVLTMISMNDPWFVNCLVPNACQHGKKHKFWCKVNQDSYISFTSHHQDTEVKHNSLLHQQRSPCYNASFYLWRKESGAKTWSEWTRKATIRMAEFW